MIFFLKLIIWNIDIHTCLLDSTFLCPHLYIIREYIDVQCTVKVQWVYSSILHNNFKNEDLSNDHWKTSGVEGFWLLLCYIQAFLLSVCRRLMASGYHFGIFKPIYCLSFVDWRLLITTLVYSSLSIVCLSSIEGFWLLLWYIQTFLLSVCRPLKASD